SSCAEDMLSQPEAPPVNYFDSARVGAATLHHWRKLTMCAGAAGAACVCAAAKKAGRSFERRLFQPPFASIQSQSAVEINENKIAANFTKRRNQMIQSEAKRSEELPNWVLTSN
ncbi:MAG: hypothetical protein MHM6MM_006278, partial [Cercozoa sp. M6MM]